MSILLTVAGVMKVSGRSERTVERWFEGLTAIERLSGRGAAPTFLIDDDLIGLRTSAENRELLKKKLKALAVASGCDLKDAGKAPASAGAMPARSKAGATAGESKSTIELADWARKIADARGEVLSSLEQFAAARNVKAPTSKPLLKAFIEAIERGEIPLTAAVREKIPTHSTLRRWWNDFGRDGLAALAQKYGNRWAVESSTGIPRSRTS